MEMVWGWPQINRLSQPNTQYSTSFGRLRLHKLMQSLPGLPHQLPSFLGEVLYQ